jgi:aminoglycoside/choline kinase family phosphotransferase
MTNPHHQWLHQQLAAQHITPTGDITVVQSSPTADILSVTTNQGSVYLKAPIAAFRHEAALTHQLASWFPAHVPAVIALDDETGWFLMQDAGHSLKALTKADGDFTRWETMLREYAAMQQASADYLPTLLELGVPDHRPEKLPTIFDELLANADVNTLLLVNQKDGITEEELAQLRAFAPEFKTLCAQLAAYNIPATLHHDDFHAGNAALRPDGKIAFIDWGESYVAHPFFSLMIVLRSAKFAYKADQTQLDHLRDVYLGCWTQYGTVEELRAIFALAAQVAAFCRALSWLHIFRGVADQYKAEVADGTPYWVLTCMRNNLWDG